MKYRAIARIVPGPATPQEAVAAVADPRFKVMGVVMPAPAPIELKKKSEQLKLKIENAKHPFNGMMVRRALIGEKSVIQNLFTWEDTPHGSAFWADQHANNKLRPEGEAYLKELLEKRGVTHDLSFSLKHAERYLENGDVDELNMAFCWEYTPQGDDHWSAIHDGERQLSDEDREYIQDLIKDAKSFGEPPGRTDGVQFDCGAFLSSPSASGLSLGFSWAGTKPGDFFWREESSALGAGKPLSIHAQTIIGVWDRINRYL